MDSNNKYRKSSSAKADDFLLGLSTITETFSLMISEETKALWENQNKLKSAIDETKSDIKTLKTSVIGDELGVTKGMHGNIEKLIELENNRSEREQEFRLQFLKWQDDVINKIENNEKACIERDQKLRQELNEHEEKQKIKKRILIAWSSGATTVLGTLLGVMGYFFKMWMKAIGLWDKLF